MGVGELIKTITIDDLDYHVIGANGFPASITRTHIFIDKGHILASSDIQASEFKPRAIQKEKYLQSIYHDNHVIVVFSFADELHAENDVKLFKEEYLPQLNCPYVIGYFAHCLVKHGAFAGNFIERDQSFSVAIFNKTVDEVINFAVPFIHQTKRSGGLIVGSNPQYAYIVITNEQ